MEGNFHENSHNRSWNRAISHANDQVHWPERVVAIKRCGGKSVVILAGKLLRRAGHGTRVTIIIRNLKRHKFAQGYNGEMPPGRPWGRREERRRNRGE